MGLFRAALVQPMAVMVAHEGDDVIDVVTSRCTGVQEAVHHTYLVCGAGRRPNVTAHTDTGSGSHKLQHPSPHGITQK